MSFSNNVEASVDHLSGAQRLFTPDLPTIHKTGRVFVEQSDLTGIHRILDLASGDGAWAISVAQAYPQMQVVAIEANPQLVEQAGTQVQQQGLENISFRALDSTRSLEAASFDLVNLRFMLGFTTLDQWPELVGESLRLLRSGGILRLTEADTVITTSTACERLSDLLARALWKEKHHLFPPTPYGGPNLLITPLLPRLLRDAGCEQIKSMAFSTNFSADMPAHSEMIQGLIRAYKLVQPLLLHTEVAEKSEIDALTQQMLIEVQAEDFGGVEFYLTAWGKKYDSSF